MFSDLFMPLIEQVLKKKNGAVILNAGNHFNQTFRRWMIDEAIAMRNPVVDRMKAHEQDGTIDKDWKDRVKFIPGSEYGAGNESVNGLEFHIAHKWEDSEARIAGRAETKRNSAPIILTAHFHKNKEVETDGRIIIESLPMKDRTLDTYLARISTVAHTTEGYVFLEVGYYQNGDLAWHRTQPIIDRNLIAKGVLEENPFLEFVEAEQILRTDSTPMKVAAR